MPTVSEILNIADRAEYLSSSKVSSNKFLQGGEISKKSPVLIYLFNKIIRNIYDQNTNYEGLQPVADYLYWLSGGYPQTIVPVCVPPEITTQPVNDLSVLEGGTISLSVVASGSTPIKYQWQFSGDNGWENISGATSSVLSISNATILNNGLYNVIVENACGEVTSSNSEVGVSAVSPQLEYSFGWVSTDPYAGLTDTQVATNAIAPVVSNYTTLSLASGDPLVCDLHTMPSQKYPVVRYPSTESNKTLWDDTGSLLEPADAIPGYVFRAVFTVGQYKYIVSRQAIDTDTQPNSRLIFS